MVRSTEMTKYNHQPDIFSFPYEVDRDGIVLHMIYEGDPISKARPRFGGSGKVYTPAKTKHYEETLRWLIREQLRNLEPDANSRFALRCLFFRATRQRIDCDNLIKAVSDAANEQVWKDDAQVMEIFGRLYLFEEHPRAEILIYRIEDSSPRPKCLQCGKEIITYPSVNSQYCSPECFSQSRRVTCVCRECGKEYEIPQSLAQTQAGFCSRVCGVAYHAKQKRAKGSDLWTCQDCDKPVSRKEYTHCQACSMKHRQEPTSNYWKSRYGKEVHR